jgi:hypothetical protein
MAQRKSHLTTKTRLRIESLENRQVPTTLTPTTFADGGLGSGSLRDAVLQFNADSGTPDDTILLLPGTYTLSIPNTSWHQSGGLDGDLYLTQTSHRWIIQGAGPSTIIDASQLQDRVFQIANPGTQVIFQGLVIRAGLAQDNGTPGAKPGTTDALGGGILNNGGDVTLDNVILQNNVAQGGDAPGRTLPGYSARGAGIYSTGGAVTITGATIADNQAMGGRGGDSSRAYYRAGTGGSAGGGGLYASGGSLDISDSTLANNRVTGGQGGDGACISRSGSFCTFGLGGVGGTAQGGGLYVNGGSVILESSAVASNQGTGGSEGGNGFYLGSVLSVGEAGGLYNSGALTVSNSNLSDNSVNRAYYTTTSGGGIYNAGTLAVNNSTLCGNSAGTGGGIDNSGTLTVSNSTLSGNSANGNSYPIGSGGGISNGGTLTVSNSTLSGNSAPYGSGGGIYTYGPVTLTNVTLTANRSSAGGLGASGGGVYVLSDLPVLHSTLIAGNFRGATGTIRDDISGQLDSGGDYNLIGDGTGMTGLMNGVNGNLIGSASTPIDPLLDSLDNYGGPTKTHALRAGSPALNAGDLGQLGVPDQRGVVRTGGVNIGSYQASATAFFLTAPDTVQAGVPFDVTVTAVDPFWQPAVGYTGTVTFSTTDQDPTVVLPADYTFTLNDGGMHTFTDTGLGETTLRTAGDQMLTVTDSAEATITGSATITVAASGDPSAGVSAGQHSCTPPPAGTGRPPEQSLPALAANLWAVLARRQHETAPGGSAAWVADLFWEEDSFFG